MGYSILTISQSYNGKIIISQNSSFIAKDLVKIFLSPRSLKLENFLIDDEFLKNDEYKKIFFIETHMEGIRIIEKPRQACSVESAGLNIWNFIIFF